MRHIRCIPLAVVLAVVSLALAFSLRGARTAPGDETPDEACLDCHDSQVHAMAGTAHDPAAKGFVSCLGCHAGEATQRHLDDPDANPAVNPGKLRADSVTAVCTTCHEDPHALNLYERDPHADADLSCNACHEVHNNEHASLLKSGENETCLECHASARAGFAMPTHHPLEEGVVACRDCHIEVAQSKKQHNTPGGPSEVCVKCHGSFQGPFPYEHEAAVDYSVNEGGCLNCHASHGSTFPRLLKQSYEAPHYSLCSQCHSVPKHLNNLNHGTQWAGVPCGDCHVDVHGSYANRFLLDPSLESQGCSQAGCHEM